MRRFLFLLLLLPVAAPAQQPSHLERKVLEPSVLFDHLSIEDGLSHSWVWSVYQDSRGFLWFGTPDGLNRYDGYSFRIYENDPADPDSLSHNEVMAIFEDPEGYLWIGTRGGGLDRFDRAEERFVHFRHDPSDPRSLSDDIVWNLAADAEGDLWIATRSGLNRYDRESGGFDRYGPSSDPASLAHEMVGAIHADPEGDLWLATGGGLDMMDRDTGTFVHYRPSSDPASLSHPRVNDVHGDPEGYVWAATAGGLDRWDPATGSVRPHAAAERAGLAGKEILDLLVDRGGNLWLTPPNGGLYRWNRSTDTFTHFRHEPTDPRSLSHDFVTALYEDETGILWIGSHGGINKYDPRREQFTAYRRGDSASFASNSISALLEDRGGALWAGTPDAGLHLIAKDRSTIVHFSADPEDPRSLPHDSVYCLFEDREGGVWVGTGGGGLARFDRESGGFVRYPHDPDDPRGVATEFVTHGLEDSSGRIWIGTPEGLALLDRDRGSFRRYPDDTGAASELGRAWIRVVFEDRSGTVWFGTNSQGLFRLGPGSGRLERLRHDPDDANSLSSDSVGTLFESSAGVLWVGTIGGGLTGIDAARRRFVRYLASDGLSSNLVRGVLEDASGDLWISTSRGLARLDPDSGALATFGVDDGLASDEFYRGAALRAANGVMLLGSNGGLTAFRPEGVARDTQAPPVVLTDFLLLNERVSLRRADPASPLERPILATDEIVLSHRQNAFTFEFAALHYASPRRNRYAYRLEGFDRTWIETDSDKRFARYTNLDPGEYVFRVKGSNHHGAWNEEGAAVRVVVRPPPWKTWWAFSLYGVLFLALASATLEGNRRKVAREREASARQRRKLASLVEQKTAELEKALADLQAKNAELEGFAYTVSHDLRSPLTTILGFIGLLKRDVAAGRLDRLEDDARRIEDGAKKMSLLLSELLDLSRIGRMVNPPVRAPFGDLAREALEHVAGPLSERGVEVEVAADLPEVTGDLVRLVEMLQNLFENAAKFMGDQPAPRIVVGARGAEPDPVFYVRDNGKGVDGRFHAKIFGLFERLDPEVEGTGIGLAIAKRVVDVHGGRIWVESAGEGRGSTFCFTLPRGPEPP